MSDGPRKSNRQEFTSRVRIAVEGRDDVEERYASNLNDGGLFVQHETPPAVGSKVLLEFVLPDNSALCRLVAEVVHARPKTAIHQGPSGMGLRFVEYDEVARAIAQSLEGEHEAQSPVEDESSRTLVEDLSPLPQAPLIRPPGPIVGIDLGTINSCVAAMIDGEARVLDATDGFQILPSTVFIGEDRTVSVGYRAVEKSILEPQRGVQGWKRFLGRPFRSHEVSSLAHFFAYEFAPSEDNTAAAKVDGEVISFVDVAAHVLVTLKQFASKQLGETVARAVITVPAYFGSPQRRAVRDAALRAGIYVERIVSEPTAAAVAFGAQRSIHSKVLVYDLGGGTFDSSVVSIEGSTVTVLATAGDPFLGGVDFDDRITEYLLTLFEREHKVKLREHPAAIQRIRFAAEMAKKQLSDADTARIDLPYIAAGPQGPIHWGVELERELTEALTQDLVDRTTKLVDSVLAQAKVSGDDLDDVLLVGGQTRSQHIRKSLMERFGRKPSSRIHPDEAVAVGAALVAHSLFHKEDLKLIDVLPTSIRIVNADGGAQLLFRSGSSTPLQFQGKCEVLTTDKGAVIRFCVGEAERASDNTMLGDVPVQLGAKQATCTVKVSRDGIIAVTAPGPDGSQTEVELQLPSG